MKELRSTFSFFCFRKWRLDQKRRQLEVSTWFWTKITLSSGHKFVNHKKKTIKKWRKNSVKVFSKCTCSKSFIKTLNLQTSCTAKHSRNMCSLISVVQRDWKKLLDRRKSLNSREQHFIVAIKCLHFYRKNLEKWICTLMTSFHLERVSSPSNLRL